MHLHHRHSGLHHSHSSLRIDEKIDPTFTVPDPQLDLYRSTLTIANDGTRESNKLGAKSRWRTLGVETEMQEKAEALSREKLGRFDKQKMELLGVLRVKIVECDRQKGLILQNLGQRMERFFDVAVERFPDARSFDVRIDRFEDGRVEALLFVDLDRECRVLGKADTNLEDIIEELGREIKGTEWRAKEECVVEIDVEVLPSAPEDDVGFWLS